MCERERGDRNRVRMMNKLGKRLMDFAVNPEKIQAASVHIYKANVKLIALVLYMDVMTGTCYTNSVSAHCWSDNYGIPNGLKGKGVFYHGAYLYRCKNICSIHETHSPSAIYNSSHILRRKI